MSFKREKGTTPKLFLTMHRVLLFGVPIGSLSRLVWIPVKLEYISDSHMSAMLICCASAVAGQLVVAAHSGIRSHGQHVPTPLLVRRAETSSFLLLYVPALTTQLVAAAANMFWLTGLSLMLLGAALMFMATVQIFEFWRLWVYANSLKSSTVDGLRSHRKKLCGVAVIAACTFAYAMTFGPGRVTSQARDYPPLGDGVPITQILQCAGLFLLVWYSWIPRDFARVQPTVSRQKTINILPGVK